MNGTPSACACITAAPDASTGPPSTCARNSRVAVCEKRSSFRRRTTPIAAHVGDQVHGLVDDRELLGTDREHQEDRARTVGADHVAQQAEAVLIRPLQVVDQDREGSLGGQCPVGDRAEVERAEQPAVGSERGEPWVVLSRHRVQAAGDRLGGLRIVSGASGLGRAEDGPGDQERAPELLVGRDGDRGEAIGRRLLGRGDEQPCLADPGLTLHGETDEPAGAGRRQLLGDRPELGRPPDHVAGRPVNVEGHRREGQRSIVVRDHMVSAGSGCEGSPGPGVPARLRALDPRGCGDRRSGAEFGAVPQRPGAGEGVQMTGATTAERGGYR